MSSPQNPSFVEFSLGDLDKRYCVKNDVCLGNSHQIRNNPTSLNDLDNIYADFRRMFILRKLSWISTASGMKGRQPDCGPEERCSAENRFKT